MQKTTIMITTARGLEQCLLAEVQALKLPVTWAGISGVKTEGSFGDALRLNLHLRTGHRVLYRLKQFSCVNPDDLYRVVVDMPWETIIPADGYLSVASNVVNETVRDTRFASLRCKDAIVDRIHKRKGKRPDAGPEQTNTVVSLYWRRDQCEIYIDTSGEPLTRRGYRQIPLTAPMQETLAAGVVMTARYAGNGNFINPMCGSGTLAIEAALMAMNKAPGLIRKNFGFMHTLLYDAAAWGRLCDEAQQAVRTFTGKIIATDIAPEAVSAAMSNAKAAGLAGVINFRTCDFADTVIPEGQGVVVVNPEYGIRMGADKELTTLYRRIGDFFKKKCQGYTGYLFTAAPELAGKIGLKSRRRYTFYSGSIECRLYEYDLYGKK